MKKRADILLAEQNKARSREKAKAMIIAGIVRCNGKPVVSPSEQFDENSEFVILGEECPYVSRGGLKLQRAVLEFGIDLSEKICLDIGCSTGGFTDCMLQNGAKYVYAVDVGYGQFDWTLRNDARVELKERTNARYLDAGSFEHPVDFVSIDVSFISLKLILPALKKIKHSDELAVAALIKPQFEAGREKVGKKGVVRDPDVHEEVIASILDFAQNLGFGIGGLTYSPIKGPNGNIEYLAYLKMGAPLVETGLMVKETVAASHKALVH
jgi:23S rRNA (cytidine1920-2'-O)/16S rRNA (cytidine1409-2'-O)-methyltransferase